MNYLKNQKFEDIKPFDEKIWLASPTMHGEELAFVQDAFDKNWITTAGENVNELEKMATEYIGCKYAVGLSSGTAALHMCAKLAAERVYGTSTGVGDGKGGALRGRKVLCSSMTFDATANPFVYEGAELVFIDSEYDTWNMDPVALTGIMGPTHVDIQSNLGELGDFYSKYDVVFQSDYLKDYKFRLMFVGCGIAGYPAKIVLERGVAEDISKDSNANYITDISNDDDFERYVEAIFNSSAVIKVVQSIVNAAKRKMLLLCEDDKS